MACIIEHPKDNFWCSGTTTYIALEWKFFSNPDNLEYIIGTMESERCNYYLWFNNGKNHKHGFEAIHNEILLLYGKAMESKANRKPYVVAIRFHKKSDKHPFSSGVLNANDEIIKECKPPLKFPSLTLEVDQEFKDLVHKYFNTPVECTRCDGTGKYHTTEWREKSNPNSCYGEEYCASVIKTCDVCARIEYHYRSFPARCPTCSLVFEDIPREYYKDREYTGFMKSIPRYIAVDPKYSIEPIVEQEYKEIRKLKHDIKTMSEEVEKARIVEQQAKQKLIVIDSNGNEEYPENEADIQAYTQAMKIYQRLLVARNNTQRHYQKLVKQANDDYLGKSGRFKFPYHRKCKSMKYNKVKHDLVADDDNCDQRGNHRCEILHGVRFFECPNCHRIKSGRSMDCYKQSYFKAIEAKL